jgi:hypothetical protein
MFSERQPLSGRDDATLLSAEGGLRHLVAREGERGVIL